MAEANVLPQLCCFLFCDRVNLEQGKFSLQGVFYRIHCWSFPVYHRFFVVVGWYGESGSHFFQLFFRAPGEKQPFLKTTTQFFTLQPEKPYFNGLLEVELPLYRQGIYWVDVKVDDYCQGSFPLYVDMEPAGSREIIN